MGGSLSTDQKDGLNKVSSQKMYLDEYVILCKKELEEFGVLIRNIEQGFPSKYKRELIRKMLETEETLHRFNNTKVFYCYFQITKENFLTDEIVLLIFFM